MFYRRSILSKTMCLQTETGTILTIELHSKFKDSLYVIVCYLPSSNVLDALYNQSLCNTLKTIFY